LNTNRRSIVKLVTLATTSTIEEGTPMEECSNEDLLMEDVKDQSSFDEGRNEKN
jgi:hypothetical protein